MLCTANSLADSLRLLGSYYATPARSVQVAPLNTAPVITKTVVVSGGTQVRGTDANLSVLAADDKGETNLVYNWKVAQAPAGSSVSFSSNNSNAAKNTKAIFSKPGIYDLRVTVTDKSGLSIASTQRVTVAETGTSLSVVTSTKQIVAPGGTISVAATGERFTLSVLDQFGKPLAVQPTISWSLVSSPSGGKATINSSRTGAAIEFNKAGIYKLKITAGNVSSNFSVNVLQTLSSIKVTPGSGTVTPGATQQFTASAFDQFNASMATNPAILWSTSAGTISKTGLLTAPTLAGKVSVAAKSGTVSGTASVTVASESTLQTPSMSGLVTTLFADGSLSRPDMIQILRNAGVDGTVDATELSDLRYLVSHAANYHMAGYVQVLASNVVNGSAANLYYQGVAAGNLVAGSSASLLTMLVDKWFLGTDLPVVTGAGITYRTAAGVLLGSGPSHSDEFQGALGDCYFIAALGAIADHNPSAIANMFIDNGDGTYTVRFYTGKYGSFYRTDGTLSDGFTTGAGIADYVTVNRQLPSYSNGTFAYSNYGRRVDSTSTPLWIALAEKAYAQWNATGKANRNGTNTYSGIEGGWMATVNAQVLGYNSTDYFLTSANKQVMLGALNTGKSVTIGTNGSPNAGGLVGSHAYTVIGYNSSTDTFNLYNPWGFAQPTPLTWAQLQSNCSMFVVADATNSTPIVASSLATSSSVRGAFAGAAQVVIASQPESSSLVNLARTQDTHSPRSNAMADDNEPVGDAEQAEHTVWDPLDWRTLEQPASGDLSSEPTSLTFERIDQVFDDIEAVLREALA